MTDYRCIKQEHGLFVIFQKRTEMTAINDTGRIY